MLYKYEQFDSREMIIAIDGGDGFQLEIPSSHTRSFEKMVALIERVESWSSEKPSFVEKSIAVLKSLFLGANILLLHSNLAETVPVLFSSKVVCEWVRTEQGSILVNVESVDKRI